MKRRILTTKNTKHAKSRERREDKYIIKRKSKNKIKIRNYIDLELG
jgi:hypothetical protein